MTRVNRNEDPDGLNEIWRRQDKANEAIDLLRKQFLNGVWITPTLINDWAQYGPPRRTFQYRLFNADTLQFRGSIKDGDNATIAFVLPDFWVPLDGDIVIVGSASTTAFPTFLTAAFYVDATTGEVTVNVLF